MMSDDELPPAIDRAMAWDPFESPARSKAAAKADTPKQKPAAATPESSASTKRKHTSTQGKLSRVNYPGGFVDALTDGCVTAGCGKFRRKFAVGQFADRAAMLSAAEAWIIDKSGTTGDKSDAIGNDLLNGAGGDEATAAGAVDDVMKRPSAAGGDETTAAGAVDGPPPLIVPWRGIHLSRLPEAKQQPKPIHQNRNLQQQHPSHRHQRKGNIRRRRESSAGLTTPAVSSMH